MRRLLAIHLAALITSVAVPAFAEPLKVGITGSANSGGRANPHDLLAMTSVQTLIVKASSGPIDRKLVDQSLSGGPASVEDLLAAGLFRTAGSTLVLATNYYSLADQKLIRRVAEAASDRLSDRFIARGREIEAILEAYDLPDVDRRQLALALIGCVVLDWDGLVVTEAEGLRLAARKHANGGAYIPWARETGDVDSVRGLYWGSHNAEAKAAWLTSFGDHSAIPRAAFPDLLWYFDSEKIGPSLRPKVREAIQPMMATLIDHEAERTAAILVALRDGPADAKSLSSRLGVSGTDMSQSLTLLDALGYVSQVDGSYRAEIPIFTAKDSKMIARVRTLGREIVRDWLKVEYPQIKADLGNLSAIRAGVPFEQMFTDVWHDLFGWTNYRLAQKGMVTDPYGQETRFTGFEPFVWTRELDLMTP